MNHLFTHPSFPGSVMLWADPSDADTRLRALLDQPDVFDRWPKTGWRTDVSALRGDPPGGGDPAADRVLLLRQNRAFCPCGWRTRLIVYPADQELLCPRCDGPAEIGCGEE